MRNPLAALAASFALAACTSVETVRVSSNEIVATGGEAVALVQADALGLSAIFYLFDFVQADLDVVVNKLLVSEAKAMGADRMDLRTARQNPRHGIFAISGGILGLTYAHAVGVAVR